MGFCTLEDLAEQGVDDLADIEGLSDEQAGELDHGCTQYLLVWRQRVITVAGRNSMTTDVTVKSLAAEIQTPVDRLVQQFADAGINKSESDSVTQQEKTLLAHLNREHGSAPGNPSAAQTRST